MSAVVLKQTPLHALHIELGAKMVEFAGYSMPVNYPDGIIAEHKHCRSAAPTGGPWRSFQPPGFERQRQRDQQGWRRRSARRGDDRRHRHRAKCKCSRL